MSTGMRSVSSPGKSLRWLSREMSTALHEESIPKFGGSPGIRDERLLESALERPRNLHAYEDAAGIPELAAAYSFGVARNHPFIDGNKRIALLAIAVFCSLNGVRFAPARADEVIMITSLAAGELTETQLGAWIAENSAQNQTG